MVHFCCVPGCSACSDRECYLSYFSLPLQNKPLLKVWIHRIGRSNLPVNASTRICSQHFIKAERRLLRRDEAPTENLPQLRTHVTPPVRRKPPKERQAPPLGGKEVNSTPEPKYRDVGVNTDICGATVENKLNCLKTKIQDLEQQLGDLKLNLDKKKFCLKNICSDA